MFFYTKSVRYPILAYHKMELVILIWAAKDTMKVFHFFFFFLNVMKLTWEVWVVFVSNATMWVLTTWQGVGLSAAYLQKNDSTMDIQILIVDMQAFHPFLSLFQ